MIIVDTHAHFHPSFPVATYFNAAVCNFEARTGAGKAACRILCLVDPSGRSTGHLLTSLIREADGWQFTYAAEKAFVLARHADGRSVHLLPGRQIVSAENLEILALNCRMTVADRSAPLAVLIDQVRAAGGVPVLPWGVGKWTGARGTVIRGLIEARRDFLLADNGNRLRGTRLPPLLAEGRDRGIPVLNGSDPLPFRSEATRIASHGVIADVDAPESDPVEAFRLFMARPDRWQMYGAGASWPSFLANQLKMQIRKRAG